MAYQHESNAFRVRKSLGLIWVDEEFTADDCGERDSTTHGPFMDLADAYEQCDRPADWRVEFSA